MKNLFLLLAAIFLVTEAMLSKNLLYIMFMSSGILLIGTLIEDKTLKRKVALIFGIPTIIVFVLIIIGFVNYGLNFDYAFKNIF